MAATKKDVKFTKNQLVKSKKYFDKVDLLNVLLKEGQEYTLKQVDDLIDEFMKKEVK